MFYAPMGMGPLQHPKQKPKSCPRPPGWSALELRPPLLALTSREHTHLRFPVRPAPLLVKHLQGAPSNCGQVEGF